MEQTVADNSATSSAAKKKRQTHITGVTLSLCHVCTLLVGYISIPIFSTITRLTAASKRTERAEEFQISLARRT